MKSSGKNRHHSNASENDFDTKFFLEIFAKYVTLCRLRLRGVGNYLIFEYPKLANTVRSKNNFLVSIYTLQYSIANPYVDFSKKFQIFLKNPKLTNTARSQTPRKLTPRAVIK